MGEERNYSCRTEKEYGFWRTLYYNIFAVLVVKPVAKFMYKLKIEGRENIPKETEK